MTHASASNKQRLLVTGAAGRVGNVLRPYLRERFDLVLFDRVAALDATHDEQVVVGDLGSYDSVSSAMEGCDAVVHLACVHGLDLTFDASLEGNVRGTMHVLDAAVEHGVRRHVYTSSHHVFGLHDAKTFDASHAPFAPDGHYALGKAFGELAYRSHGMRHGWRTMVIRIGNAAPRVPDARAGRMWVSARDLADLVRIGLTSPDVEFDVVYGVSNSQHPLFDNDRAHALGYEPRDWAEDHWADDFLSDADMPHELGGRFVGGAYAAHAPVPTGTK